MKIFILVNSLTTGGAERVASLWAQGFHNRGYDVHVILNNRNKPITYNVPDKVKIINLNSPKGPKPVRIINYISRLRGYVKKEMPDIIITVLEPQGIYAKIATLGLNIPIINTEHNAFGRSDYRLKTKLFKTYVNKIYKKITVLTQADKNIIGNNLKDVTVLPNPLSLPILNEENTNRSKTILAVGRLNAYKVKGFDLLIKSWSRIASQYPDWKLKFIGEGDLTAINAIRSYAENDIDNQLEFVNFSSNIIEHYRDAEIFVLSSRYEGFGMVLIEAMSQGCACIACDYGGRQKEIIEDENYGIVIPNNQVEAICTSLKRMISNEELRINIQKNAPIKAAKYSLDNIMQKWNDILKSI